QSTTRRQLNGEIRAFAPFGEALIQRMTARRHHITEGLEESAEIAYAATTGDHRKFGVQRDWCIGQLLPILAAAGEGTAVDLRDGNAEKRGSDVGPIVDVLIESPALAGWAAALAHQSDGIDIEQECGSAALGRRLRIEDVDLAEGERKRL